MAAGSITHQVGTQFTVSGITAAVRSFRTVANGFRGAVQAMATNARRYFAPILRGLQQIARFSWAGFSRAANLAFKGLGAYAALATLKIKGLATAAIASSKAIAELMNRVGKDSRRLGLSAEETSTLRFAFEREGIEADEVLPTISEVTREFGLIQAQINKQSLDLSKKQASTVIDIYRANARGDLDGMKELASGFSEQKMQSFQWLNQSIAELEASAAGQNDRYGVSGRYTPGGRLQAMQQLEQMRAARDEMIQSFGPHGQAMFTLQRFGLDVDKAMKPGIDSFYEISDAFQRMTNPAEKLDIAMKLFGEDAGAKMVTILEKGRYGIEQYRKEMERLGGTITTADTKLGADYSDSWQKMLQAIQGVRLELARQILPLLIESQGQLTEWLVRNRKWIAETMKTAFIQVRAFMLDIIDMWHGQRTDFRTGWLNTVAAGVMWVKDLAIEAWNQIQLVWAGKESDWPWLNSLVAGLKEVRTFATEAWKVMKGGTSSEYAWMNVVRHKIIEIVDVIKSMITRFKEAWDIVVAVGKPVHDFFATLIEYVTGLNGESVLLALAIINITAALTGLNLVFGVIGGGIGLIVRGFQAWRRAAAAAATATAAAGAAGAAAPGAAVGAGGMLAGAAPLLAAAAPFIAAAAVGGGVGYMAAQYRNKKTDEQEWAIANEAGDIVRQIGDQSYDRRHNNLMRAQTQEGQDYRIKFGRQAGVTDRWSKTSAERAAEGPQVFDPRMGTFVGSKKTDWLIMDRAENDRLAAMAPQKKIAVEFSHGGQSVTAIADEATEKFFVGVNNAINSQNRR